MDLLLSLYIIDLDQYLAETIWFWDKPVPLWSWRRVVYGATVGWVRRKLRDIEVEVKWLYCHVKIILMSLLIGLFCAAIIYTTPSWIKVLSNMVDTASLLISKVVRDRRWIVGRLLNKTFSESMLIAGNTYGLHVQIVHSKPMAAYAYPVGAHIKDDKVEAHAHDLLCDLLCDLLLVGIGLCGIAYMYVNDACALCIHYSYSVCAHIIKVSADKMLIYMNIGLIIQLLSVTGLFCATLIYPTQISLITLFYIVAVLLIILEEVRKSRWLVPWLYELCYIYLDVDLPKFIHLINRLFTKFTNMMKRDTNRKSVKWFKYDSVVAYAYDFNADKDWVEENITKYLEKKDFTVFDIDNDILPNQDVFSKTEQALEDSKRAIVVFSTNFIGCEKCQYLLKIIHASSVKKCRVDFRLGDVDVPIDQISEKYVHILDSTEKDFGKKLLFVMSRHKAKYFHV